MSVMPMGDHSEPSFSNRFLIEIDANLMHRCRKRSILLFLYDFLIVFFCTGVANRDFGLKSDAQVSQTVLFDMSKS